MNEDFRYRYLEYNYKDIGIVFGINDGIVYIKGLHNVTNGEMVTIHITDTNKIEKVYS